MANPQPDKFIRYSKEYHAALAKIRISGVQHQILQAIIFFTWGQFPSVTEAQISQQNFMDYTGLNSVAISKAKKELLERCLITKNGNYNPPKYSIQKDYDIWNPLPKKVTASNIKGSQRRAKNPLPKLVTTVTKNGNRKKSHLIYNKNKELAIELYEFYKNEIDPLRKTKKAALKNISFYLKEYSVEDLKKSIENYGKTALRSDRRFRKNPSNFFGRTGDSERYFEDYLPDNMTPPKSFAPQITTAKDVEAMLNG